MSATENLMFQDAISEQFVNQAPIDHTMACSAGNDLLQVNAAQPEALSCNQCGKTFKHRSSLKEHGRVHMQELPYACPHPGCSFRYKWRSSLSNHRRYHEDSKPAVPATGPKRGRTPRTQAKGAKEGAAAVPVLDDMLGTVMSAEFWEILETLSILSSETRSQTYSDFSDLSAW